MNTNSNNLQAMPTVTPEALGTVDERSKQNNVEDGLEQRRKNVFRTRPTIPAPLLTAAPYRREPAHLIL